MKAVEQVEEPPAHLRARVVVEDKTVNQILVEGPDDKAAAAKTDDDGQAQIQSCDSMNQQIGDNRQEEERRKHRRYTPGACPITRHVGLSIPESTVQTHTSPSPRGYTLKQTERRCEWLYGDELFDLIDEQPLAWLPLGILEKHGGHLPWGLDGHKAHAVCTRLATELGGVVLPANHQAGIHGDFRVIVAYTGHYPAVQTQILQEAAEAFSKEGPAIVIPFWEELACGEGDHAGKWETSIYLALDPDAVRLDAIRDESTGKAGHYRGQDVRSHTSHAFGMEALAQVEAYLSRAVAQALGSRI